jgi:DNA-binding GntR family transcriptional regulator
MTSGPVSRIEWVEAELRAAILNGDLEPGERLLTAQLSERFSVSPTPLREALHRFAGEGLVEFVPQRGARVTSLSSADCMELTELRSLLDPLAVRHAIAAASSEWRKVTSARSADLCGAWASRPHDGRSSEKAYRAFYDALTSTCRSDRLRRFAGIVRDQEARYRSATIAQLDKSRLILAHEEMVRAAFDGDADGAVDAIVQEVSAFAECYLLARTEDGVSTTVAGR